MSLRFIRTAVVLVLGVLGAAPAIPAQTPAAPKATNLRSVLLEQLHSTHDRSDWFVCLDVAVAGMTPDQARWTPKAGGRGDMHSVAQLVAHVIYWNERSLAKLKGEPQAKYSGNNEDTFVGYDVNSLNAAQWVELVQRMDRVLTGYEQWIQSANDDKLANAASLIAHVGAHNAYHTGEIVYVRKLQGSWNPDKGVK
jgi:uncharacterized damage-inducible protein DinB